MSVLENNSTKMAEILAAVNALPNAGGGGGGGSVETCTVTVNASNDAFAFYTTYIDGVFGDQGIINASTNLVCENVLCNSVIVVEVLNAAQHTLSATVSGNIDVLYSVKGSVGGMHSTMCFMPTDANGGTISITANTGGYE